MQLFGPAGRRALLEFLRNLTPQILLFSSAIILFISSQRADAKSPLVLQVLGVGLIFIWFVAFLSNFENFLESAFSDSRFIGAEKKRILLTEKGALKLICALLGSIATHSKVTFVELVLALIVIYGSALAVLIGVITATAKIHT